MRAALIVTTSLLIVMPFQASAPAASDVPIPHLRPLHKDAARIVADGMAHSATFRSLANALEQSDVIVYVELRPDMQEGVGGSLRFLARSATHRFLRIQLSLSDSTLWRVALLGHELQHAVEVANAPDVDSSESLRALYRRIGVATGPDSYDSVAARQVGYVVRDELSSNSASGIRFARGRIDGDPAIAAGESLGSDGAASSDRDAAAPTANRIELR
jgi:hypothetical protein